MYRFEIEGETLNEAVENLSRLLCRMDPFAAAAINRAKIAAQTYTDRRGAQRPLDKLEASVERAEARIGMLDSAGISKDDPNYIRAKRGLYAARWRLKRRTAA